MMAASVVTRMPRSVSLYRAVHLNTSQQGSVHIDHNGVFVANNLMSWKKHLKQLLFTCPQCKLSCFIVHSIHDSVWTPRRLLSTSRNNAMLSIKREAAFDVPGIVRTQGVSTPSCPTIRGGLATTTTTSLRMGKLQFVSLSSLCIVGVERSFVVVHALPLFGIIVSELFELIERFQRLSSAYYPPIAS